jgi:diguanylate cyclase (GGDEF)-like protein/PAS domain S-box-containing protein
MLDLNGVVTSWNAGAQQIKGYTAEEIIGQHYSRFYTDEDRKSGAPERALRIAAEQGRFETDAWRTRKDGSLFWANVVIDPIYDDGVLVGFAKITRDITERRNTEEHLRHLAHTDALTGMANRYFFLTKLGEFINQGQAALLVLDLDAFKEVNDTLGDQVGDLLLKAVGNRIEDTIGRKGVAGRLGGDEFGVALPNIADPIEAARVSEAIIRAFRAPFVWDGREIQIGVSIGIAISPNHGSSAEGLLANGDLALHDAKSRRQTGYSLFQETFRQSLLARRNCEQELRRAVAEGELELYYQPQVRLADRQVVGAEALLRWNHPQQGLLSPGAFINVLERSSLAFQVGHWIIQSACAFAARARAQGHNRFCVAVNLFGVQLRSGDLVSVVSAALAQHQLPPDCLELEITENVILQHDEAAVATLRELAQLGVRTAFDDYGTGYASLSVLKRFPIARLKIDQSFIRDLCTAPEDAAVVKAILYLGRSFGLDVVAEGIEREDQKAMLREFGCLHGQGYLYAKPMRAVEMQAFLDREAADAKEHDIVPAMSA